MVQNTVEEMKTKGKTNNRDFFVSYNGQRRKKRGRGKILIFKNSKFQFWIKQLFKLRRQNILVEDFGVEGKHTIVICEEKAADIKW